jgi:hypothetical protein
MDKELKLVYYDAYAGMSSEVNEKENELTILYTTDLRKYKIQQMIEQF